MTVMQVHAGDTELLDAIFALHSSEWQPKWATCAGEHPYPTRAQLDFYANGDFRIFVTSGYFDGLVDGYAIFNLGGKLLWGYTHLARDGMASDMHPTNAEQLSQLFAASVRAGATLPTNRLDNPLLDAGWDGVLARATAILNGG